MTQILGQPCGFQVRGPDSWAVKASTEQPGRPLHRLYAVNERKNVRNHPSSWEALEAKSGVGVVVAVQMFVMV